MTIGNTGGWRNYANTQRRIAAPGDLAGLKMRTVPADLPQTLATTLGASPTPIPWPELFTSLQTGVVEGTANGITDIMSMKFTDAGIKYLTLDGHSYMGAFWWMGNDRFKSLTPEQQQIVVDGLPPFSRPPSPARSARKSRPTLTSALQGARSTCRRPRKRLRSSLLWTRCSNGSGAMSKAGRKCLMLSPLPSLQPRRLSLRTVLAN
jgi:hypothetical protein